jgi:L-arabinose isomerase
MSPLKIGLFGIGLDIYWAQFPGLQARLEGYCAVGVGHIASRITKLGDLLQMEVVKILICYI